MKIRLMGTRAECDAAVAALRAPGSGFDVLEVSPPAANRGDSKLVRVYVETGPPAVPNVQPDPARWDAIADLIEGPEGRR